MPEPTMKSFLAVASRAMAKANSEIIACGHEPDPKFVAIEVWAKRLSKTPAFVTDSVTAADYLELGKIDGTSDLGWATVNHGTGPFGERFVVVSDCNGRAAINADM